MPLNPVPGRQWQTDFEAHLVYRQAKQRNSVSVVVVRVLLITIIKI